MAYFLLRSKGINESLTNDRLLDSVLSDMNWRVVSIGKSCYDWILIFGSGFKWLFTSISVKNTVLFSSHRDSERHYLRQMTTLLIH